MGAALGLVGLAIHAIGEFPMHIPAIGLLAMVLAGQVASLARFASDRWWFTPRAGSRAVASALVLAALVFLAPTAWRGFREARALAHAHGESMVTAEFIRALESAGALRSAASKDEPSIDWKAAFGKEALVKRTGFAVKDPQGPDRAVAPDAPMF